eukprot:3550126-Lingulodinium_polyedra.AAC.1
MPRPKRENGHNQTTSAQTLPLPTREKTSATSVETTAAPGVAATNALALWRRLPTPCLAKPHCQNPAAAWKP